MSAPGASAGASGRAGARSQPRTTGWRRETSRLRRVALAAAADGFTVFPLAEGGKSPIFHAAERCRRRGACAEGHLGWEQRATVDPDQIRRWWSARPNNIAIACGPSRLLVIDLDIGPGALDTAVTRTVGLAAPDGPTVPGGPRVFRGPDRGVGATRIDGRRELAKVGEQRGVELPTTLTVRTPSGGQHRYFRMPPEQDLRNTQSLLAAGIDTRGAGGYVVAAGSATPAGPYRVVHQVPIAPLPDWLVPLLTPPPPRPVPAAPHALGPERANAYLATVLDARTRAVRRAPVGTRQETLYKAARRLGQFVGGGELDPDNAYAVLYDAARVHLGIDAMDHHEIHRTISRGIDYGTRAPITLTSTHPTPRPS